MICNRCGVQFNSPFCPNCGAPAPSQPQINQPQQTPPPVPPKMIFQQNSLMQKHSASKKKKHGCLFWVIIVFGAMFFVLIFSGMISACVSVLNGETEDVTESTNTRIEVTNSPAPTSGPTVTPEPTLTPKQTFTNAMVDESGLKKKSVSKLYNLLTKDLGFSEVIYSGKSDYGDIVFNISADNYELMATIDDDEIYSIICGDFNLYEDSTVKINKQGILDREITDGFNYYTIAQEIIKSNLKSPKSADFPSMVWSPEEIAMQRNRDLIAVKSYVDAQNSFGADIRSEFLVEFQVIDIDTYTYNVIYINIDGETYGEFIDLD